MQCPRFQPLHTLVLSEFHCLPICHRLHIKIETITHRVLQFQQASYTSLHSVHSMHLCDHFDLQPCQYVFPYAKPLWLLPLDHFRPSHQKFEIHCQVIIPTLPAFFVQAYPDSRTPDGTKPSERITLRDITPLYTVIEPSDNNYHAVQLNAFHLSADD